MSSDTYFVKTLLGDDVEAGLSWFLVLIMLAPSVYLLYRFPLYEGVLASLLFLAPLLVILSEDLTKYLHENTRVGPWYQNSRSGRALNNFLDVLEWLPLALFIVPLWIFAKLSD